MEGKRTIRKISLKNFLSYGSEGQCLELEPLNVLIGPNASGKSNLLEAFRFLKSIPTADLTKPIREGGGATEYLWKGASGIPTATIDLSLESLEEEDFLNYKISFTADDWQRLSLREERIQYERDFPGEYAPFIYRYPDKNKQGLLYSQHLATRSEEDEPPTFISQEIHIDSNRSVLGWIRNPDQHPELAYLENLFLNIQFAGEWQLSRFSPSRLPQRTDLPTDTLWEDASNLGLILNNYSTRTRQEILNQLKQVYPEAEEIHPIVQGNTVQIFIHEQGSSTPIPAIRLSDGTLRYLCLLILLKQPKLPPVLCIEEPETGLHPDVIHSIAELLIEASQRTQLIVTTHSEFLVSALSDIPEAVIVCERDENGTQLNRPDPESLKEWLERYSLGDLWMKGELGGTRW